MSDSVHKLMIWGKKFVKLINPSVLMRLYSEFLSDYLVTM